MLIRDKLSSLPPSPQPSRLIFGSCSSQHYPEQSLWSVIQQRNATAFVWAGDAVYADDRVSWSNDKNGGLTLFRRRKRLDPTPEYLRNLLENQRNQPQYKALLETNISIFGTIDDHDGSTNNGDTTFPWKRENTMEFVRFLGLSEQENSPMFRRAADGQGVYGVQVYDFDRPLGAQLLSDEEAGLDPDVVPNVPLDDDDDPMSDSVLPKNDDDNNNHSNKRVAIFVLDVRSNRTPWRTSVPERFQTDTEGDFLGEEQWAWFETAIGRSDAAVNVIVTGLQVHPERFWDSNAIENWSGVPRAQHRLYQALLQPNVKAPILISGDVHHAQLMRKDCRRRRRRNDQKHTDGDSTTTTATSDSSKTTTVLRPLYETTTSGMTHSWGTQICGRANGNPFCHVAYYRVLFRTLLHLAHKISPWNELLLSIDDTEEEQETSSGGTGEQQKYRLQLQYSLELNVAELDFDWDRQKVSVNILGVNGRVLLHQDWTLDELTQIQATQVDEKDFDEQAQQQQLFLADSSSSSMKQQQQQQQHDNDDENEDEDWVCVHYRGRPNRFHFAVGILVPLVLLLFFGTLPMWLPILVGLKFWRRRRRRRAASMISQAQGGNSQQKKKTKTN